MYKISARFYILITKDTSIKLLTYKVPKPTVDKVPICNIEDYSKEKEEIKEEHTMEVNSVKEEIKTSTGIKIDEKAEKLKKLLLPPSLCCGVTAYRPKS